MISIKKYFLFLFLIGFATTISAQKNVRIGITLDKKTQHTEVLLQQLKAEIKAVIGEDAFISFKKELENNFSLEKAKSNYQSLVENDTDIILAFGIVNNNVISKMESYLKPTIVFGALSKELAGNEKLLSKSKNYISFTSSQSYEEDLNLLIKLAKPTTIGVAIEKAFADNLPVERIFKNIGESSKVNIKLIPFLDSTDITNSLDTIDALYLAGGFYLSDAEIKNIADVLIEKKLPSFTANSIRYVLQGILATNHSQSELNQYFRRIALTIESVVNGIDLSELDAKIETDKTLTVNYKTAEKIDLSLKYSLIASTSFVGDSKEIVADKIYNLQSIMQEAIVKNLKLKAEEKDILINEKDVEKANSDYLPNLKMNVSGNYIDQDLAKISNGQNPEFSTLGNLIVQQTVLSETANANISIKKSLLEAQKENYNSEALNTVYNVATAYFTALILKANLSIQNQNLELTKYNLKIATENYESGQSGKSDVLRFKSEKAQNTQQMIEALNKLEQSYYVINQLLNNPIDTNIDVEEAQLKTGIFKNYNYEELGQFLDDPSLKVPFVKFLVKEGLTNSPELKSLNYNIKAAERSQRLYGIGRFIPTIALQGQYNYEVSRSGLGTTFPQGFPEIPQAYYTLGLNVSLPIFNQNKQNINKEIANIQKEQLEISKSNVSLNIEKNINDAVLELINQISNIELSKVFEETAKEALELTRTSYESGAVNIVQLLDAQNNYLQAQLASTNANYNYLQVSMQLERSLGLFFLLQDESQRKAFVERFIQFKDNQE